jgi:hypothetical protein
MCDKAHCKIKYDDQQDMDEISDFYDFRFDFCTRTSTHTQGFRKGFERSCSDFVLVLFLISLLAPV